jgi:hypothetical protein
MRADSATRYLRHLPSISTYVAAADHLRRLRCKRGERLGSFGAEHAEPGNMHTLAAVIEAPTRRAESAICRRVRGVASAEM